MTQVLAGSNVGLTQAVAKSIMELLSNQWPTSGYDPVTSDIDFGLSTWNNYGDIDIHVTADRTTSLPATLGWAYSEVNDGVVITLFVRKNADQIPDNMGNTMRKVEEIIKDNAASGLGNGISLLWRGWDRIVIKDNLQDVWQVAGYASAIYYLAKV